MIVSKIRVLGQKNRPLPLRVKSCHDYSIVLWGLLHRWMQQALINGFWLEDQVYVFCFFHEEYIFLDSRATRQYVWNWTSSNSIFTNSWRRGQTVQTYSTWSPGLGCTVHEAGSWNIRLLRWKIGERERVKKVENTNCLISH